MITSCQLFNAYILIAHYIYSCTCPTIAIILVVRQVNKYKLLCPRSPIADNYKYYVVNIELTRQIDM